MNLDGCTPDQRKSIQNVQGPQLISAGAGSGKTFTLTQRIAYALLPDSGPALNSIDEVLAITFTDRAAAEIKARVKRTLRQEGLYEEARKVDEAWISTIHGMCSRILHTHALELGIDPSFTVLGDVDRADMLAQAIDDALGADNPIIAQGSYAALFNEYPARSTQHWGTSIASMLKALLDNTIGLRGGLDTVDFGPKAPDASSLTRELLLAYEEVAAVLEQQGSGKTAAANLELISEATDVLNTFLLDSNKNNSLDELAATVNNFKPLSASVNNDAKPAVKEFQTAYRRIASEILLGLAHPLADELMSLAREVADHYDKAKRQAGVLDNDDLLTKTLEAFESHPDIAVRYQNKFKLVMVDEFQDTSQLQIDLISYLAGENLSHLCTVGDVQQSIYRFRGADVHVYEKHKRTMQEPEIDACCVELSKNFRSHPDILSFVDRVFEQPQVFGEKFMSLDPDLERPSTYQGHAARINVVLVTGKGAGVSTSDGKQACAEAIAQQFAQLVDEGHSPSDMVILMGKMTNANLYADALREVGLECVTTGGSQFSSAPEVRVVARFLEALANQENSAALFEVLTSDMVRLSSDDLLRLGSDTNSNAQKVLSRDISSGFAELMETPTEELSPQLLHAVELFNDAWDGISTGSVATAVRNAVVCSGWMARLEQEGADGTARAANILKALRMIEDLESKGVDGLASLAREFSAQLSDELKESPGSLSGEQSRAVRIMTIHSAKGLEFPIVALAEFAGGHPQNRDLLTEVCGSWVRASLMPNRTAKRFDKLKTQSGKLKTDELEADPDFQAAKRLVNEEEDKTAYETAGLACAAAPYRVALKQRIDEEELAEARRKMYVGLTRAREALIVALNKAGNPPEKDPLGDDILAAFDLTADSEDAADLDLDFDFGGSEPAHFKRIRITAKDTDDASEEQDVQDQQDTPLQQNDQHLEQGSNNAAADSSAESTPPDASAQFFVPSTDPYVAPRSLWNTRPQNIFSYSSIAPASHREFERDFSDVGDADKATDLGSAFHRAAQYAIQTHRRPDSERLTTLAQAFDLSDAGGERLNSACDRWFSSKAWDDVNTWASQRAEVPFFVQMEEDFLEGFIDLLCVDPADAPDTRRALVIDYKTGGTPDEDATALHDKHLLQAQCYAFVLLLQGYTPVELHFERVEQDDGFGQPQEVCYDFSADDLEYLRQAIIEARIEARAN